MVAPKVQYSGASMSISIRKSFHIEKIDEFNYIVDGTPVDCVHIGEVLLNGKIDLVVSGCNNGNNISFDILYSGTCGACFQSLIFKHPAIALSLDYYQEPTLLQEKGKEIFDYIFAHQLLSPDYFLNVNFPKKHQDIKGIKLTAPYRRTTSYQFEENGDGVYLNHYHDDINVINDNSLDISAITNGYVSISKIKLLETRK
jgi:5'-nucleotidase